jgi:acyl-CoA-binding protein
MLIHSNLAIYNKFYGYFKQAKEGECTDPKPGFWDVVKKAKW